MKKLKALLLCFVVTLLVLSPAVASSSIQATIFPVTFSFNGENRSLDSSYEVLNYQDYTYVPIRFVAESLDAGIDYDAHSRNIEIQRPEVQSVKSEIVDFYEENDFLLAIYSEKESYKKDEFPRIWATLIYIGENSIELTHDSPLIQFGIRDKHGNDIPPVFQLSDTTFFQKYEQFYAQFLPQYVKGYNANTSNVDFLQASSKLPEGDYTIYISSRVLTDGLEEWEMSAEIDINVLP